VAPAEGSKGLDRPIDPSKTSGCHRGRDVRVYTACFEGSFPSCPCAAPSERQHLGKRVRAIGRWFRGGAGDGGGGDYRRLLEDEPITPPYSVQRALHFGTPKPFKKVGKLRRDVTERTEKQVTDRVRREVYKLRRIPDDDPDKEVLLRNIKVGINHVFKETDGTVDLKRFLPAIYH